MRLKEGETTIVYVCAERAEDVDFFNAHDTACEAERELEEQWNEGDSVYRVTVTVQEWTRKLSEAERREAWMCREI